MKKTKTEIPTKTDTAGDPVRLSVVLSVSWVSAVYGKC